MLPLWQNMIERHEHNNVTWLDVINPTTNEIREIVSECKIPPEFSTDLTTMVPRHQVHAVKGALKVTLDFPIVKRTDINHPHEIKCIATKDYLITIRFEAIEAMHRFSKEFEVTSILTKAGKKASGGHMCMSLLERLYKTMTVKLDYLESKITSVEERIFTSKEKEMLYEISEINRRLIAFRQTLHTHQDALEEMPNAVTVAFGKPYTAFVEVFANEYDHIERRIQSLTYVLNELRQTNDTLLNTKQNEVMKIFTILAFITFPLTLFTSMFGMNTVTTPIVGQEGDFWIILGTMGIVSIAFFAYFKYRDWI